MSGWVGGLLRSGIRLIDTILRKQGHLYEFDQNADCILRIQLRTAPHPVTIGNIVINQCDPVVALHLWNERMPKLPREGAQLEWAVLLRRKLVYSFKAIATELQNNDCYVSVKAVCGLSALFSFSDHTGGTRMMQHLGFTVLPYYRPKGHFGEFWENLFSWWLMWTYNESSLHTHKFWHLERTEIWMPVNDFILRYGEKPIKYEKT